MGAKVGLVVAVLATHTGSCVYPRAQAVEIPEARATVERAGIVADVTELHDDLAVSFVDGTEVLLSRRQYVIGSQPHPGDLVATGATSDGLTLVAVIPYDEELDCYSVYSPAAVRGDSIVLGAGIAVPLSPNATDEDVIGPGDAPAGRRPLTQDTRFFTHDAACLDSTGHVVRIERGIYEGGDPGEGD